MSVVVPLPRIHPLAAEVADQIAAGEVIERPASVVKELVENSIDAAASKITINIAGAGIKLIRVQDNGQGIHKDDLALALQSHATSKLTRVSDLSQIASLGFRGEALPSIASVSHFQLISRQQHAENAWSIDNSLVLKPAAHAEGTTVVVKDLFHATPARRKFLKSERTEWLHIQSLVKAMALGHSNITFQIKYEDQHNIHYASCAELPQQRIADVCGKAFLQHSLVVDAERESMHVRGWMGLNDAARSQTDRQYFFVNGRLVQDKHIQHALRLACSGMIASGRYPSYVLYLQLDPADVDINVHPAKSEVRFAEPRNVHDFIYGSLTNALVTHNRTEVNLVQRKHGETGSVNEAKAYYRQPNQRQHELLQQTESRNSYLGLAEGRFLIVDTGSEQLLIDVMDTGILLSLHELLYAYRTGRVEQRTIQVSVSCELTVKQQLIVQEQQALIAQWGFIIEPIAPGQVTVRAIPAMLSYADVVPLVKDFLNALYSKEHSEQVAARLAEHVNDAGLFINNAYVDLLLEKIHQYEQQDGVVKSLPWCRLDAAALAAMLNT